MRKIHYLIFSLLLTMSLDSSVVKAADTPEAENFIYDDHGKRDPFWSLVSPSGALLSYDKDLLVSEINLEGIMADSQGRNIAIINGTIVKQGNSIGLFEIVNITKTQVILKKGQEQAVLDLNKGGQ